jgi:predicted ATPase
MRTLEKLVIKNFKSIREQTLKLARLNVFIGGNGVGKAKRFIEFAERNTIMLPRRSTRRH